MERKRRMKKLKDEQEEYKLKMQEESFYNEIERKKRRYRSHLRERPGDMTMEDEDRRYERRQDREDREYRRNAQSNRTLDYGVD
jgi:hypothetical protein